MANHKSALKRHKQDLKHNARNRAVKTRIRSVVKAVRAAVKSGDQEKAAQLLTVATSTIGKASGKGVLHWKNAARKVSRLAKAVNAAKAA